VEGSFWTLGCGDLRATGCFASPFGNGRQAFVYCLIEHKGRPAPRRSQLLRYLVRVWERLDRAARHRGLLPPVLPMVVYHGKPKWTTPLRFSG
jgi:hypothetical protein